MIEVEGVEYMTPAEAAASVGVKRQCVYDWIRADRVTPIRAGRSLYVDRDQVARAERDTRGLGRKRADT